MRAQIYVLCVSLQGNDEKLFSSLKISGIDFIIGFQLKVRDRVRLLLGVEDLPKYLS